MLARRLLSLLLMGALLCALAVPALADGEEGGAAAEPPAGPAAAAPEAPPATGPDVESHRLDAGLATPPAPAVPQAPAPCAAPPDATNPQSFYAAPVMGSACCPQRRLQLHAGVYAWLAGHDGDLRINGLDAKVDSDFTDELDNLGDLDFFVQGQVGARYGRLWFEATGGHEKVGGDSAPVTAVPSGVRYDTSIDVTIVQAVVGYQLGEMPLRGTGSCCPCLAYDLYAGVRYWRVHSDLTLGTVGAGARVLTQKTDWFDPFFGGRMTFHLPPHWQFVLEGDIGGLDLASRFTWHAGAWVDYGIFTHAGLRAGWQWLGVDYRYSGGSDPFQWNVVHSGPFVGVDFRL